MKTFLILKIATRACKQVYGHLADAPHSPQLPKIVFGSSVSAVSSSSLSLLFGAAIMLNLVSHLHPLPFSFFFIYIL